jgi:predicted metal-dependent hydrolase
MDSFLIPELGANISFVRNDRARRYVLRVPSGDAVRCTVPRRGNMAEAARFVQAHTAWIKAQLEKRRANPPNPSHWPHGHEILYRGEKTRIEVRDADGVIAFADQIIPHRGDTADLRPIIERRMRWIATKELPPRVRELAAQRGLHVARVSVRAQKSRWGSCSHTGTISLNWRLVQTPPLVRDYVIVHELMHMRHMNHSDRFWNAVAEAFPEWKSAETWLKRHGRIIR